MRWPVEEDFQVGKDQFGLDHSQVRLYTALTRHLVLTMAALAICALTAAATRDATSTLPPAPIRPDDQPPPNPGLIPLTVAEVKRLLNLLTRTWHGLILHLHWPGGDAATKPAPAGFINGHDSNARPKQHDQVTKCGCRTSSRQRVPIRIPARPSVSEIAARLTNL